MKSHQLKYQKGKSMESISLALNDYVRVHKSCKNSSLFKNFYFDLKFITNKNKSNKNIEGPCIYLISVNKEVIYIGKYQTLKGNFITNRWLKHLTTISMRGERIGFGPDFRIDKILSVIKNKKLKSLVIEAYSPKNRGLFFRDSGHTTSINRLKYADSNWSRLKDLKEDNFLNFFNFDAFMFSSKLSQINVNSIISNIEIEILNKTKPPCNKEFSKYENIEKKSLSIQTVKSEILKSIEQYSNISDWKHIKFK